MLKNDEVDYCTKCTAKPTVKEHMCEECYTEHCQWLRELSAPKQDSEGMMTERYYKVKSLIPNMTFNILKKKDGAGNVDWFLSENNHWGIEPDIDGYFTKKEINNLEPVLRDFVLSKFCVLEEL